MLMLWLWYATELKEMGISIPLLPLPFLQQNHTNLLIILLKGNQQHWRQPSGSFGERRRPVGPAAASTAISSQASNNSPSSCLHPYHWTKACLLLQSGQLVVQSRPRTSVMAVVLLNMRIIHWTDQISTRYHSGNPSNCYQPWNQWGTRPQTVRCTWSWWWQWQYNIFGNLITMKYNRRQVCLPSRGHFSPSGWMAQSKHWWSLLQKAVHGGLSLQRTTGVYVAQRKWMRG